ncbi:MULTISPECIES: tripartite tricarboxylate transporter substrate-binding protein [Cupriavidus]|uniref:tripartite tricarboxylate transporter substrate-binding protein n=1 Tax=Cupriavidus TaxID=106589 RepID=UPI001F0D2805|nr:MULTISPECIES: tripartite tricarboxylate transporter substrate-binding protein [Cupriavidus]
MNSAAITAGGEMPASCASLSFGGKVIAGDSNLAFNPFLYPKLPYNPSKDLTGVAMLANCKSCASWAH